MKKIAGLLLRCPKAQVVGGEKNIDEIGGI
jgi:hypothetical protein